MKEYLTWTSITIILVILTVGLSSVLPLIQPPAKALTVTLTSRGFQPAEIIIIQGQTVTFTTSDNQDFWPASNLHPYHTIYADFDPKRPLSASENWQFTFDKTGIWRYHDHLRPSFGGKIIVKDNSSASIPPISYKNESDCQKSSGSNEENCWLDVIQAKIDQQGVGPALDYVTKLYSTRQNFAQTCHSLVHKVGEKAYFLFEKGLPLQLTGQTAICAFGFFHGFMETLLVQGNDLQSAKRFCDEVGVTLANSAPDSKLQCYHGIGHGSFGTHDPSIKGDEDRLLTPAIKLCEEVSTDADQLYRCVSGVYNAIALAYANGEYALPFDKDDPFKMCRKQNPQYQEACFGNMNTILSWSTKEDLLKGSQFIAAIPNEALATSTMRYWTALLSASSDDTRHLLVNNCRQVQPRLVNACIEGLIHGILEHGQPGEEYKQASEFCQQRYILPKEKVSCADYILNYAESLYSKEKVTMICQSELYKLNPNVCN